MTESNIIETPWTEEQVHNLHRWQHNRAVHPYTCGAEHPGHQYILYPTADGWRCPDPNCKYLQTWAWEFSTDGSFPDDFFTRIFPALAESDADGND